jgi:hypothetical protein
VKYTSALFKKTRANGEGSGDNILIEFVDSMGNRRWGFGIAGAEDAPWLNANGSLTASTQVTPGDTYFLVAKIVSSAAGMDTGFLKVFGTGYASQVPAAEPTTWDVTLTETTNAILDRIRVRLDSGNTTGFPGQVDEIRLGDTWASVTGGLEPPPNVPGDFNGDQIVDDADFAEFTARFGELENGLDGEDFLVWQQNYGTGVGPGISGVPEPGTAALAVVALVAMVGRRRRTVA